MTNIVLVTHIEDSFKSKYTFKVPNDIKLHKGDMVWVKTRHGNKIACCKTDSHVVADEIAEALAGFRKVTGEVIGRVLIDKFDKGDANKGMVKVTNNIKCGIEDCKFRF